MGDISMDPEDIIAEPDEPEGYISLVRSFLFAYGWYIIGASLSAYYLYKNHVKKASTSSEAGGSRGKSPEEIKAWQLKEEQRMKAVQRLQEQYNKDAAAKAEKQKQLEEEKRKARLEEMQKLTGQVDVGQKLGSGESSKKSLRPEYNPLMGDARSSERVCFRRPGGGSGGGG